MQISEGVAQQRFDYKTPGEGFAREICYAGDTLCNNGIVGSGPECFKADRKTRGYASYQPYDTCSADNC